MLDSGLYNYMIKDVYLRFIYTRNDLILLLIVQLVHLTRRHLEVNLIIVELRMLYSRNLYIFIAICKKYYISDLSD